RSGRGGSPRQARSFAALQRCRASAPVAQDAAGARVKMSGPSNRRSSGWVKSGSMRHKQHSIATGFTASSTADEVLAGIDLAGKNVVITGGHAGLGLETTRALARAGAFVTVGARDPDRAARAVAGIQRVEVGQL